MANDDEIQIEPVSSVMKVFAILSALSTQKSLGVTELSRLSMTSKSTVYRFLQTMKMLGYVRQEGDTDKYSLTLKLFEVGAKALEYSDLVEIAEPHMNRIGETTHEALHLGIRDADNIVYVFKVDAQYNLRMQSRIGRRNPLYSTAIGKVLLAEKPEQEVREILANTEFLPSTTNTHKDAASLIAELAIVREQGFGEDVEEQEEGLRCVAAPIYDRFGNVIAGMSLSYPTLRHSDEDKLKYIEMLQESCKKVSDQLGYRSQQ
ncbi:DNA-binding transcriptional regulator KdgR [Marinomonas mediterranea]|jgi:transcriptional regulator|uniref:Transcriptional regulator, IclR family n=1 Tax=Marinomonas mediterranea (strain ATCC 700492 / JCM 21426 / NBRC 103028 / MMB-1) TaxID=717774 RepID=F2K0B1_MARM1|nr:DNA-binding transcriptional regulator KdgR [Marinomonas mediterranea]ADZ89826.1 transcriptional regulator, IclR family [Marinomonas mediterranea MMB-1]WCN07915.1 DNA-binding transcriptional regulator KdgR [Marinomonas mediterranea]WCN12010.1 DNA-binding transcriptional regulator KdgR [Marinomonas mediterranea]WCN16047.1 DNA-binding transcriptional regulator KdgR [Marinomonas mediterranea MMB-1]